VRLPSEHEYGNGVSIFTRDGDAARDFVNRVQVGMVGVNFAIPCRSPITPSAAGALRLRRSQSARTGLGALLHQDQDGDAALADRHQSGRRVRDPDNEMTRHAAALVLAITVAGCAGSGLTAPARRRGNWHAGALDMAAPNAPTVADFSGARSGKVSRKALPETFI